MKVLVVEDDEDKRAKIVELVHTDFPMLHVLEARSFQSGMRAVEAEGPDFIILDMTMRNFDKTPTEDGGRPHPFAGREILRSMKRDGIEIPTVIITQFEEFGDDQNKITLPQLASELQLRFPNYRGTIEYRHHIDAWRGDLRNTISSILSEIQS